VARLCHASTGRPSRRARFWPNRSNLAVTCSGRNSGSSATRYARYVLWVIVGILVLLWFLGLLLRAAGGFIHLLIIVALVIVIYRLLTGRRLF
jgi:hypothetical protein